MISTDVLSEGLNLQDATRLINYDLHWNPVRLMQRIGRVDRRMDPAVERRLDSCVAKKALRISMIFGIEGKKLLKPEDDFNALRDFLHVFEGQASSSEKLHLEYQKLLQDNSALEAFLNACPLRLYSGKDHLNPGTRAVFFCYRLPAEDKTVPPERAWDGQASRTGWYIYDNASGNIIEDSAGIAEIIRSSLCARSTDQSPSS